MYAYVVFLDTVGVGASWNGPGPFLLPSIFISTIARSLLRNHGSKSLGVESINFFLADVLGVLKHY